jgi:hypothetical protein
VQHDLVIREPDSDQSQARYVALGDEAAIQVDQHVAPVADKTAAVHPRALYCDAAARFDRVDPQT